MPTQQKIRLVCGHEHSASIQAVATLLASAGPKLMQASKTYSCSASPCTGQARQVQAIINEHTTG